MLLFVDEALLKRQPRAQMLIQAHAGRRLPCRMSRRAAGEEQEQCRDPARLHGPSFPVCCARATDKAMARSIGMRATPALASTQP